MIEWINNTFGISNEISVPTLISIIVFVTGGIINFLFLKLKEYKNRKQNRDTFRFLLNEVNNDLRIKEKNMLLFYPKISIKRVDMLTFPLKTISYLDIIFELDYKDIYYSYRKKNLMFKRIKDKAFHKIWANLNELKFREENLHNNLKDFNTSHNDKLESYNKHIEKYREYSEQQIHKQEKGFSDFILKEKQIWLNWEDLGEIRTHHYYSYNHLVLPLLKLNRENSNLAITLKSGQLLVPCELDYQEIENTTNYYHLVFKNYYTNYRNIKKVLIKCLDII